MWGITDAFPAAVWDGLGKGGTDMNEQSINLTLSRQNAEILLGVLASARYNPDVQAVCDELRAEIDRQLNR